MTLTAELTYLAGPSIWVLDKREHPENRAIRGILSFLTGQDAETVTLDHDLYGKLITPPSLDLSVSRAGNFFIIGAIREGKIGVDIEILSRRVDEISMPWLCFTDSEKKRINSLPIEKREKAFLECWTAKEAFVKAIGLGLQFGLEQVEMEPSKNGILCITRINGSQQLSLGWHLKQEWVYRDGQEAIISVVHSTTYNPILFLFQPWSTS